MLAVDAPGTWRVFRALDRAVGVDRVVIENEVSSRALVAGRARRLGWRTVAGQLAFQLIAQPILALRSRRRVHEILAAADLLDAAPAPEERITRVPSVNDPRAVEELLRLDPGVVVVGGTRIISRATLETVPATFLNMHAGITPRYRGVH